MRKRRDGQGGDGEEQRERRFPRAVYTVGEEPDPRFSLANERTFLAWIRTSLAFVAAGVALEALGFPQSEALRGAAAAVFIALGIASAIRAWVGWMSAESALRRHEALPAPSLGLALVIGLVAAVVLVTVGSLV